MIRQWDDTDNEMIQTMRWYRQWDDTDNEMIRQWDDTDLINFVPIYATWDEWDDTGNEMIRQWDDTGNEMIQTMRW